MGIHYVGYCTLPDCCRNCIHCEWDAPDEYSSNYYFCLKGQFIPTKKKACKRKQVRKNGTVNG